MTTLLSKPFTDFKFQELLHEIVKKQAEINILTQKNQSLQLKNEQLMMDRNLLIEKLNKSSPNDSRNGFSDIDFGDDWTMKKRDKYKQTRKLSLTNMWHRSSKKVKKCEKQQLQNLQMLSTFIGKQESASMEHSVDCNNAKDSIHFGTETVKETFDCIKDKNQSTAETINLVNYQTITSLTDTSDNLYQEPEEIDSKMYRSTLKKSSPNQEIDSCSLDSDLDESNLNPNQSFLNHLETNRWYTLDTDSSSYDLVENLSKKITDLNNIQYNCEQIHQLWRKRNDQGINRLSFFYKLFDFLFEKYIKVSECNHNPRCKQSFDYTTFKSTAIPILKKFFTKINQTQNLLVQIELLASIETLLLIKKKYWQTVSEVFDQMFNASIVDAIAFKKWSKLTNELFETEISNDNLKTDVRRSKSEPKEMKLFMEQNQQELNLIENHNDSHQNMPPELLNNHRKLIKELIRKDFPFIM